jgi:hypothetical protein
MIGEFPIPQFDRTITTDTHEHFVGALVVQQCNVGDGVGVTLQGVDTIFGV